MADFKIAIEKVLKHEGGYTKNPNDSGNYQCQVGWAKRVEGKYICENGNTAHLTGTNRGISANTLRNWKGRIVSDIEMINLTEDEAIKIYKKFYWDIIKGDAITDQSKAEILFDAYVNQTGWVATMLSDTLKVTRTSIKYPLSPVIIQKINSDNSFVEKFVKEREKRYLEQADNPGQMGFLKTWLSRIEEFQPFGEKKWIVKIVFGVIILGVLSAFIYKTTKK